MALLRSSHLFYRIIRFLIGLSFMTLGIVLVTKANLGTTPISSIPYVLSLGLPLSLGVFTIIINLLMVFMQIVLMRKKFPPVQFLQIPIVFLFGTFLDLNMWLLADLHPATYLAQIGFLFLGSVVLALGVYVEVAADVVLLPGEGMVKAITHLTKADFGKMKVWFDCSLVAVSVLASFWFFHEIQGIREGTLLSAILVGNLVWLFHRIQQAQLVAVGKSVQ